MLQIRQGEELNPVGFQYRVVLGEANIGCQVEFLHVRNGQALQWASQGSIGDLEIYKKCGNVWMWQ